LSFVEIENKIEDARRSLISINYFVKTISTQEFYDFMTDEKEKREYALHEGGNVRVGIRFRQHKESILDDDPNLPEKLGLELKYL